MSARNWRDLAHQNTALSGLAIPKRRTRRPREKRFKSDPVIAAAETIEVVTEEPSADPVRIARLAMETLGPASMRASFSGIEVRVAAPDDSVAAIFRAVLAETARHRSTDRLIRVVVE
jgi:hypothetical protein